MVEIKVSITSLYPPGQSDGIRAYATATIADCLSVRGIKIVERGQEGLCVAMPSRKTLDGYREICSPVTTVFRDQLHSAVLDAYRGILEMGQDPATAQEAPSGESPQAGQHLSGM